MWYSPGGTRQQYVLEEAQAYDQPLSGLGMAPRHYPPEVIEEMKRRRREWEAARQLPWWEEQKARRQQAAQLAAAREKAKQYGWQGVTRYTSSSPLDAARQKAAEAMFNMREAQAARQRAAQQAAQDAEVARQAFYGESYMGYFGEGSADPQVAQDLKDYQDGIAACQQAPDEAQKADCIRQWEEYKKQLDDYQKQLDAYNAQVAQARQTQAVQPQAVAESRSLDTGAWQFGPRVSAQQKTLYEAQQQHGQTGQPETWMQKVQRTFQEGKIWSAGSGIGERKVAERLAEQKGAKARAREAAQERAEARAWGADVAQKMKEQRLLAKTEAKAKEEAAREEAVRAAAKEEAREANQKAPQQSKEEKPTQEELRTSQLTRAFAADAARRAALAQQKADESEIYKRRVEQANKPVSPVPSAKQYFGVPYRPLVHQPVENKWAAGQQPFGPGGMMLVKGGGRPATPSLPDFSTPGVSASYGMPRLKGFSQLDLEEAVVWGF